MDGVGVMRTCQVSTVEAELYQALVIPFAAAMDAMRVRPDAKSYAGVGHPLMPATQKIAHPPDPPTLPLSLFRTPPLPISAGGLCGGGDGDRPAVAAADGV